MARFTTDLTRGYPPSSVAVFFDGGDAALAQRIARYRAAAGGRADLNWRDTRHCPEALTLFGVGAGALRGGLFVKDRYARLHAGLGARIVLWRELEGYGWRCLPLDLLGLSHILSRPVTPSRAAARRWRFGRIAHG